MCNNSIVRKGKNIEEEVTNLKTKQLVTRWNLLSEHEVEHI